MIRRLFTSLIFLLPVILSAQTLRGIVFREGTESAISGVSVYYNGSLRATITNEKGEFSIASMGQIPVTISCIGYKSASVIDSLPGKVLKIYLKPKAVQLREVLIGSDGMSREEKLRLFTKEFLGTSDFARSCTIINPDDIYFTYTKKTRILTAESDNPIKIQNQKLGYQISYYLNKFVTAPGTTFFSGNFIFLENREAGRQGRIRKNRKKAYEGSRMQFIRALWTNTLDKEGFKIYSKNYKSLAADSILTVNIKAEKFVNLKGQLVITHPSHEYKRTYLSQTHPYAVIDKTGFYDMRLRWAGHMSTERIGDMLPYEYQP